MAAVPENDEKQQGQEVEKRRQPAVFVNHGGGPLPYLQLLTNEKFNFGGVDRDQTTIIESCQIMGKLIKEFKPSAILVVSAHWEEDVPSLIFKEKPSLLYDYFGFPRESYGLKFDSTCDTKGSEQLLNLLKQNGFKDVNLVKNRGWDHGVFIPLLCSDVEVKDLPPLMQLSLINNLDPESHVKLGTVLSTLREKNNIMIVGSGMLFHNMGELAGPEGPNTKKAKKSKTFTDWITNELKLNENNKDNDSCQDENILKTKIESLQNWSNENKYSNEARFCHPREEHLLPLHVIFGTNWNPNEYQLIMKENPTNDEKNDIKKLQAKLNTNITKAVSFGSTLATCVFY